MKKIISAECDLWTYLQNTDKKIVMYGMGNGADKILRICDEKNIVISDFFASDGFVRGHQFHGKTVLSYSEIKEKYANPIILLSFATCLPDVMEHIEKIASETELYVPSVPVFGNTLFDMNFYCSHEEDFASVSEMFADDFSRDVYSTVIDANLTGKLHFLKECTSPKDEPMTKILSPKTFEASADLGAYNGDTIRELANYAPNLKAVYAMEPDRRTFKKLSDYAETEKRFKVICSKLAAWNKEETLYFDESGNRNSNISDIKTGKKISDVSAATLDGLLCGKSINYIKYDVEGSEREAIEGSKETIMNFSPELLVSMYHRSEDMFSLPKMVYRLYDNPKFYLRRFDYFPAWDLNLYVVP